MRRTPERIDLQYQCEGGSRFLPFDSRFEEPKRRQSHRPSPASRFDQRAIDHLEFNLFPRLGRGPYSNASCWAADIYHPDKSPVKEHRLVPKDVRLIWGWVKNLLSGVTTVAHHNPYDASVFNARFPVCVLNRYGWAHSLDFSPDIADLRKRTPAQWPFIVHAAEGTDERAHNEIPRLKELGVLDRRTVLVHAVGMASREFESVLQSGASIVWCPSSNLFTLGRTLTAETVKSKVPIALATDSALTGSGDLIDEMRSARMTAALTATELYPLVTTNAASILRLSAGQGTIREGGVADLVAVADTGQTPAEALANLRPEMVMVRGRVMLASTVLRPSVPESKLSSQSVSRAAGRL